MSKCTTQARKAEWTKSQLANCRESIRMVSEKLEGISGLLKASSQPGFRSVHRGIGELIGDLESDLDSVSSAIQNIEVQITA